MDAGKGESLNSARMYFNSGNSPAKLVWRLIPGGKTDRLDQQVALNPLHQLFDFGAVAVVLDIENSFDIFTQSVDIAFEVERRYN